MSSPPGGSRRRTRPETAETSDARQPDERQAESGAGLLARLIVLSDGVFAIAMTLLVVQLTVPEVASGGVELGQQLWALWPRYLSYAISFLVIASYWISHQRIFQYIVRADHRLVWLNALLLLCIAFQPFPTSVLGTYSSPAAVTFYAGTLVATGAVVLGLWLYATTGRRLVSPRLDQRLVEHHAWRAASAPFVFLLSIGIAQVNPTAAEFFWLVLLPVIVILRWRYRDAG